MTNPSSSAYHHYNQLSWGACQYYRSATSGQRFIFRPNEIASVIPGDDYSVVLTVGGCEYPVTTYKPEMVR